METIGKFSTSLNPTPSTVNMTLRWQLSPGCLGKDGKWLDVLVALGVSVKLPLAAWFTTECPHSCTS